MKTAIIHDWLVNYAGSERVVESFTNIWQEAEVFCLVDFLNEEQRSIILKGKKAHPSFIQNLPLAKHKHRNYLPLFPKAIESFDLSKYDLIISSSHSVAKGVRKTGNQLHICYCHSPMRYIWEQSEYYLKGIKGNIARIFINYLRKWDLKSAESVDYFVANSNHIAEKIRKIYNRNADVIYPPVDTGNFPLQTEKEDYYFTAARLVPYKKVDLIVEAFSKMPDKKLIVAGSGPEKDKIKSKSGKNIEFAGYQSNDKLRNYMQKARAFVFAAEEDFGIIIIEALSSGTPVIAYSKGGTGETITDLKTGIHFHEQSVRAIKEAVIRFEKNHDKFDPAELNKYAARFDRKIFEKNISDYVNDKIRLRQQPDRI